MRLPFYLLAVVILFLGLFSGILLGTTPSPTQHDTSMRGRVPVAIPQEMDLLQACDIHATQCTVTSDALQGTTAPLQGESRQVVTR